MGSRTLTPTPIVPQEVFAHRGKKQQTELLRQDREEGLAPPRGLLLGMSPGHSPT